MSALTDHLNCHESWEPAIIEMVERHHRGILKEALVRAVEENAVKLAKDPNYQRLTEVSKP